MADKLTKTMAAYLSSLSKYGAHNPWKATGPNKAMCNKLVRLGLAYANFGNPVGYTITSAGRAALKETNND